jgi:hypothetical protein
VGAVVINDVVGIVVDVVGIVVDVNMCVVDCNDVTPKEEFEDTNTNPLRLAEKSDFPEGQAVTARLVTLHFFHNDV